MRERRRERASQQQVGESQKSVRVQLGEGERVSAISVHEENKKKKKRSYFYYFDFFYFDIRRKNTQENKKSCWEKESRQQ